MPLPSLEVLNGLLSYCPETGRLRWKVRVARNVPPGIVAGSLDSSGYRQIKILGRVYKAHRIAWMLFYGDAPNLEIDHINCDRIDNRISNLRQATASQNAWNRPRCATNTSGIKGVYWYKSRAKWHVRIKIHGRTKHLGYFTDLHAAAAAYASAAPLHHGEFARLA